MDTTIIEVIGIIATLFILAAFSQSKVKRIRILDSIGAFIFIIYGVLISSWSVSILNAALLTLNIIKICKNK